MSYDLYLRPTPEISVETFSAYFEQRLHYVLNPTDNGGVQAFYENEDTGTYFSFDFFDANARTSSDQDSEAPDAPVAFNMNYFRPHVFGLEAAPEVTAFVDAFSCQVYDPQMDGMGEAYSEAGFLRGWNSGNLFGYRSLCRAEEIDEPAHSNGPNADRVKLLDDMLTQNGCIALPGEDIAMGWRWNMIRREIEAEVDDAFFVPRVFWALDKTTGHQHRIVIWGQEVPILLPSAATHVIAVVEGSRSAMGWLKKFAGGVRARPVDALQRALVSIADLNAIEPGEQGTWKGQEGIVYRHGPEGLSRNVHDTLIKDNLLSDLSHQMSIYGGAAVRNIELIAEAMRQSS